MPARILTNVLYIIIFFTGAAGLIYEVTWQKYLSRLLGSDTIATAVSEDPGTIEEVYEPFLIKEGYLKRTPRGREVTPLAYKHLGKNRQGELTLEL